MSGLRGFVIGIAGLALLEVVVANVPASGRVEDLFDMAAKGLSYWLDPDTPLIPDLGNCGSSESLFGEIGGDVAGGVLGAGDAAAGLLSKTTPTPKRRKPSTATTSTPTLV